MSFVLTAAATRTIKPINQDACQATESSIVVADGIGSFYQAEFAATYAAQELARRLAGLDSAASTEDYTAAFGLIQRGLKESEFAQTLVVPTSHPVSDVLGTTLLCAQVHNNRLTMAYVGNGAILHLRGGFADFPDNIILPWNALNYLNPHSVAHDGRNALVRFISANGSDEQCKPTVLQLQLDTSGAGDILILCSDGIHSNDQVGVGYDGEGNIWVSGDKTLQRLYHALGKHLLAEEPTPGSLQVLLEDYLVELEKNQLIGDDCTLAVLITEQALKYFQQLRTMTQPATTAYAAD